MSFKSMAWAADVLCCPLATDKVNGLFDDDQLL
jgi:hypothetical protein